MRLGYYCPSIDSTNRRVIGSTMVAEATGCRAVDADELQNSFHGLQHGNEDVEVHPIDALQLKQHMLTQHCRHALCRSEVQLRRRLATHGSLYKLCFRQTASHARRSEAEPRWYPASNPGIAWKKVVRRIIDIPEDALPRYIEIYIVAAPDPQRGLKSKIADCTPKYWRRKRKCRGPWTRPPPF